MFVLYSLDLPFGTFAKPLPIVTFDCSPTEIVNCPDTKQKYCKEMMRKNGIIVNK